MCIMPSEMIIHKGPYPETIKVPCRECWRCRANRVNDYVGRCLAEASTSDWTLALTLTYAPRDDLADKVLTPSHFQQFARSLRDKAKYKTKTSKVHHSIRYLACGEYGALTGRAHFHCILFGKGEKLEIPHQKNHHIDEWSHGHVYGDWNADEKALRYTCKYLLKGESGEYWFSLSKKPPLGSEWFAQKARRSVERGVLPSSFEYLPPFGHRNRPYLMTGATRRDYIDVLVTEWMEKRPLDRTRLSEWVAKALEKYERDAFRKLCADAPLPMQIKAFEQEMADRQLTPDQVKRNENRFILDTQGWDDI